MGGLGALDYAARLPGMFTVAASFSGIVHTRLSNDESQSYLGLIQSQGEDPLALWGDPDANVDTWKQHNPYDLAPQLKSVRLFISAGNGRPGPLDRAGTNEDSIETSIGAENRTFARRVQQLGLDAEIDLYGPGTHNWVYWERSLHHGVATNQRRTRGAAHPGRHAVGFTSGWTLTPSRAGCSGSDAEAW